MDGKNAESSVNSAPMVLQYLMGHEFHSCIPRIAKSSEGAITANADGTPIRHLPIHGNLHVYDLPGKCKISRSLCSKKEKESSSCGAEEMNASQMNKNQEESNHGCDAVKETSALNPFYSLENESSRKRLFTLLDTDDNESSTPKSVGSSAKDIPWFGRIEMDAIHGSSSIPRVPYCMQGDKFKEKIPSQCIRKQSSLSESISDGCSALCGTDGNCVDGSSTPSGSRNVISTMKLRLLPLTSAEAKNDTFNDRPKQKEHIEERHPSSLKNLPFGVHGDSTVTVSKWRTDSNAVGKNKEFLEVKKDYWFSHFHLETCSEDCDAQTLLNLLFPDHGKLDVCNIHGCQHEESGRSLYLIDEVHKSTCLDTLDGEKTRSSMPSWIEKYTLTRETMKAKPVERVCDARGSTPSIESTRFRLDGMIHTSPACNSNSNLALAEQPCLDFIDKQKDKDWQTVDASRVECHSSSSGRPDAVEAGCLQSNSSFKCLTSSYAKKRAKVETNKEGCEAILSPTLSYDRTSEHDLLLSTSQERTLCLDVNALHSTDMEMSLPKTVTVGGEDLTSHVERPEIPNPSMPFESTPCPSNGWVRRLKLHSMDPFALGTKGSVSDAPISGRVDKLYTRVLNYSRCNSNVAPAARLHLHGTEPSSVGAKRSRVELLKRSHAWIHRWCRDGTRHPQRYGQGSSEMASGGLEGKQLPSIAAMALMGKAASSFRPCEFRRRGTSSVVWNTKGFQPY